MLQLIRFSFAELFIAVSISQENMFQPNTIRPSAGILSYKKMQYWMTQ
jgi:hypothetical protein